MRLYGTSPSHFTRKVRVLLQELKVPYEFVQFQNLMEVGPENFASNPLHMFPVLERGALRLIESDLICEYIISNLGQGSHLSSFWPTPGNPEQKMLDQQRLAIMNGGMSAGVTLLRAKRSGLDNWEAYPYFRQELSSIDAALRWLDASIGANGFDSFHREQFTMLDITLMCFVEWAHFREFLRDWSKLPNLKRFVDAHRDRPSFKATHPSLSGVTQ